MITNEEVKLMYNVMKGLDRVLEVNESKFLSKLEIMVEQIEVMRESQEKMAKLQDRIVALEKGDSNEEREEN